MKLQGWVVIQSRSKPPNCSADLNVERWLQLGIKPQTKALLNEVSDRINACLRLPNIVQEGDRIHVYPVASTPAVTSPVGILRFVLNIHLGKMNFLAVVNIVSFICQDRIM